MGHKQNFLTQADDYIVVIQNLLFLSLHLGGGLEGA